ncbi:DUF4426 domain-containing protein [uncultured Marinobacter sp.]|uniref:DUF4426 domain-containing protein n=1 Tax=uncultured Marinobacter sp. TaxID=187379 RepID=UPI0030D787ED
MRFTPILFSLITLACLWSLSITASAQSVRFGDYEIHYSVFPSTFLTPEVAAENNLRRSRSIGIVNISLMKRDENGHIRTVQGQVEGQVLNEIRQTRFLAFRRIQEGDSVYFISEYQYRPGELMVFQLNARPSGHDRDLPVRFSHTLFND